MADKNIFRRIKIIITKNKKFSFKEKVYKIVSQIPKGKVVTYGQVSQMAGKKQFARAVGVYMKINPNTPAVPCHRVVSSKGELTGYSGIGGIKMKKLMLLNEGVLFTGNKVNLSKSQWKM